jgi:glycosyltransferase involved in cell wall biosynthesis
MLPDFKRSTKIIQQALKGPSVARNLAASIASGRYLAFLDADDVWHSSKLDGKSTRWNAMMQSYLHIAISTK